MDESNCDEEVYFLCAQTVGASVDFLFCNDGSEGSAASKAKKCAERNKPALDFEKITSCFNGDEATELKKKAALYFDGRFPDPVGVPHIEINGKAWGADGRSEAGLIKALCATGIKAGACDKAANSTEPLSYM